MPEIAGVQGGKLKVLSRGEIHDLHNATLEVLEKVGVLVKEENALKLLEDAGAQVDYKTQRARIPSWLIEEGIKSAPKSLRLCGRNSKNDIVVNGSKSFYGLGGTGLYIIDLETGERRVSTKKDLADATRLADALENIHFLMGLVIPQDVMQEVWDRHTAEVKLINTEKHSFTGALGAEGARDVLKMASLVVGGEEELKRRPIFSFIECTVSPLTHDTRNTETIMELARHHAPIIFSCEALSGATSPATIAGTLVVQNAENLSGFLIAQLASKGAPVIYGTVSTIMDMKEGTIAMGAPEVALISACSSQLAQFYQIPIYSTGGTTDANVMDEQAAYEQALQTLFVGLAGGNLIHNSAGTLEKTMTGCFEQMVIQNEIIGMAMRLIRGIEVNSETLAVEVIERVGPSKHFLSDIHTRKHFMQEQYFPKLSDRKTREKWEKHGAKTVVQRAREIAREILKSHYATPLDSNIEKQIHDIVIEAENRHRRIEGIE